MKHSHLILGVICILYGMFFHLEHALGWQFPVLLVSKPSCKTMEWNNHDTSCKLDIKDVIAEKNAGNTTIVSRLVFSVLRGATYTDGRDIDKGGHSGVDIVSAKGTPVNAIGPGEVINSGRIPGFGNSVSIKHLYKEGYIYSNYSHLNTIKVEVGDIVNEGEHIGNIGNSGRTFGANGNHLDFQLTKENSPSHPYGYTDCSVGYMTAVQQGACRKQLLTYTIDPLKFFSDAKISKSDVNRAFKESTTPANIEHGSATNQQQKSIVHETSYTSIPYGYKVMYAEPTHTYIITSHITLPKTGLQQGKLAKLRVLIDTSAEKLPFSGTLDKRISVSYNKDIISISPDNFNLINRGKKDLFVKALKTGTTDVTVSYGDQIVARHQVIVK